MNDDKSSEMLMEIQKLRLENKKLSRELRMTTSFMERIKKMAEAKEALGNVLTAANIKQQAYTDMLLDSCPNIIFLLDDDGKFVLCTKAFLTIAAFPNFDYIKNRTYHEVFKDLLPEEAVYKLTDAINEVINEKTTVVVNEYLDFGNKGNLRHYSIDFMILEGRKASNVGVSAGVLAVFTDITDFMREKERAEIANRAKSDFLASMSHEIRTPMNAILGMTEIVSRGELNTKQQKFISDIKKSSQSLLAIINDILDFSKIEAGKMDIVEGYYNLPELLDNIHSMFTPLFKAKNLNFYFIVSENIHSSVYGDENRLRQIINNLLSNALKYTFQGSVEFRIWLSEDNKLRFDISDTGIGIREDDLTKLFLPFEQLDLMKNKNINGTGLGLAISHRLCKMMGGDMWVSSKYGAGSTFSVKIPCIIDENAEQNETEKEEIIEFTAESARILVVDDIEINLSVAEAMLQIFNINPDLALSGAQAIEMSGKERYDIIFMDQMMPEMDGIEATMLIRQKCEDNRETPIIALTANVIDGAEKMLLEQGFNGFLPKPLEIEALNICLKKWLPDSMIRY